MERNKPLKKSEAYYLAQVAVVSSSVISPESKLEMLRLLMEQEDLALYCEKKETENT